ncbi:MAG TPA: carboxylesterase family protein [Vicinamibacterales bacterium]|nr:carboxylesterase family protein [Vicinamibacterales bacterium]
MARKNDSHTRQTRRAWMKTAAVLTGAAAAKSVVPPGLEAQTSRSSTAASMAVRASAQSNVVETTAGRVRGFAADGIHTFKGIPYAASTAGAQRFMAPAKPTPWTGVRSALALGPSSPQAYNCTAIARRGGWNNDEEAFMFDWDDGRPSEDCLRVNVWTPGLDAGRRPVLVWIHGGGYSSGSSNELRMYDGESLSRRGNVVVVSLNHRLGVLGYLNLAEHGDRWASAGNAGMLDIVAALGWIKENIASFGGDPGRVMIFGQSGGGGKVGNLMGMPSARGLFQRAAIQSGSTGVRRPARDRSAELAAAVLHELGLTRATLDKLQELPYERIVEAGVLAQRKMNPTPAAPGTGGGVNWAPVVDGRILPEHPWDPHASPLSAEVPLLVGTTLNEFANSIQAGDPSLDGMTLDEVKKRLAAQRGERADQILQSFQQTFPNATPYELFSRISGMTSRMNAVLQAERKEAQRAAPVYLYWFQWQTPILDGRPRAFHCAELPFVFYNTDRCATMTGGGGDARELAGRMADAWVAFARTGDPNHAGLPKWPAFTAAPCPTMVFDDTCVVANGPDADQRRLLTL